jgi:hypothetical protein
MEQLMQDDTEPQIHFSSRVYLTKCTAVCAAYKKYCNGLKKADCVLVRKYCGEVVLQLFIIIFAVTGQQVTHNKL